MKRLVLTLTLFALAIPAAAADTGKWSATIQGQQGASLAGTADNDFTGDVAIANGRVAGDTIALDVTFDFGGNAATFHYKGEVGADASEFMRTAAGDGPWAGER